MKKENERTIVTLEDVILYLDVVVDYKKMTIKELEDDMREYFEGNSITG